MPNDNDLLKFLKDRMVRIDKRLDVAEKLRRKEFDSLKTHLESTVVGSKVFFYGTRRMQLGHSNSHINVFLDVDNSYWMSMDPKKVEELIEQLTSFFCEKVTECLYDKNPEWSGPVRTLKTPVPTVRVGYKNLQVDVTVNSGLGVENTNLVHFMFKLQPEAFKLYHFARLWIHIDVYGFKRYMVGLLVIFYLQSKNLLPSVVQLQEKSKERFIDGWNVEFDHNARLKDFNMTAILRYEDHLIDFFKFYGDFDFANNVISPYLGRAVPVGEYPKKVPELQKFQDTVKNFHFSAINVADVLNLNFNMGYNVGKKRVKKFINFCPHAQLLLQENLWNTGF